MILLMHGHGHDIDGALGALMHRLNLVFVLKDTDFTNGMRYHYNGAVMKDYDSVTILNRAAL